MKALRYAVSSVISGLMVSMLLWAVMGCSSEVAPLPIDNLKAIEPGTLKLTVIYDNLGFKDGLKRDWGFACLIQGPDQSVLFDTGQSGDILLYNMTSLGIDPRGIDLVLISHDHPDHFGGLLPLLAKKPSMPFYVPKSMHWPKDSVPIGNPQMLLPWAFSSGEMKNWVMNEQSLIVNTQEGLVLISGCAHQGIDELVVRAKGLSPKPVLLVMGGFHLDYHSEAQIKSIIDDFHKLGVRYVAPSHCTGALALRLFAEAYGPHFIKSGVGQVIKGSQLAAGNH